LLIVDPRTFDQPLQFHTPMHSIRNQRLELGVKTTAYLETPTPIWLFTLTLYGAPVKNYRCLVFNTNRAKIISNFSPKPPNFGRFRT